MSTKLDLILFQSGTVLKTCKMTKWYFKSVLLLTVRICVSFMFHIVALIGMPKV